MHAYVVHGAVPTLIDAPSADATFLDQVADALTAAGDGPLQQVLATHAHPDHVAGAAAIAGRFPGVCLRKHPWPARDAMSGVAWEPIEGEPMLPAGDGRLWAVETPGHSPDHLCFLDVGDSALFAGDLVINGGTVTIPASAGGNLTQYLQSLRKVIDLQSRRMLPAHGQDVGQPTSLLRSTLSHRMMRERQVLELLAAGVSNPDAIVERLYASVAPPLKRAARENVLAHLAKLAHDGVARADGDVWTLVAR